MTGTQGGTGGVEAETEVATGQETWMVVAGVGGFCSGDHTMTNDADMVLTD